LDHGELPDPVAEVIQLILERQDEMDKQIRALDISKDIIKMNGYMTKKSEIEKEEESDLEEIFAEGAGI
jgi:serine O-acetyltransferase